jgi:glycosyltransferase involved in cell wall biosynthesis
MKVSIITVCFNSAATIRDTIESVIAQDYADIEYLVIDGGSDDTTMDIVAEYRDRIDVVVSEPDRGIYDAMNKGIERASGDVIAILNSDDFYSSATVIGKLMGCMEETSADTVFADLAIVDAKDTKRVIRYYESRGFHPGRLRYGWMPAHPTLLVRRELYEKLGKFSLEFRIAADFEMVVRLYHNGRASYAYVPIVAVKMRAGGISTGGLANSWILNREIVLACRINGIRTSLARVLLKMPAKMMEYLRKPNEIDYGS